MKKLQLLKFLFEIFESSPENIEFANEIKFE